MSRSFQGFVGQDKALKGKERGFDYRLAGGVCRDDLDEEPETIADFIAENRLETVVVWNLSGAAPSDSLRHAACVTENGTLSLPIVPPRP